MAAESGRTLFVSTGMSTLVEVDAAVKLLEKHTKVN
jgi:sialic acid synthase SpsE